MSTADPKRSPSDLQSRLERLRKDLEAARTPKPKPPLWLSALLIPPISMAFLCWAGLAEWLLWGWFAVPAGAPDLEYWHVVGLGGLVGYMVGGNRPEAWVNDEKRSKAALKAHVFSPPIIITVGWIVRMLMGGGA